MVAVSSVRADGIVISKSNAITAECSFMRHLLWGARSVGHPRAGRSDRPSPSLLLATARHAIRWPNSHGLIKLAYEFGSVADLSSVLENGLSYRPSPVSARVPCFKGCALFVGCETGDRSAGGARPRQSVAGGLRKGTHRQAGIARR